MVTAQGRERMVAAQAAADPFVTAARPGGDRSLRPSTSRRRRRRQHTGGDDARWVDPLPAWLRQEHLGQVGRVPRVTDQVCEADGLRTESRRHAARLGHAHGDELVHAPPAAHRGESAQPAQAQRGGWQLLRHFRQPVVQSRSRRAESKLPAVALVHATPLAELHSTDKCV